MAISFDSVSKWEDFNTVSSITWSHTCSWTNRILVVGVVWPFNDTVTWVTYNWVAMTQVWKIRSSANAAWTYTYILVNPSSWANNVVVSSSVWTSFYCSATSYNWAKQSSQPDAFTVSSEQTTTSYTQSVSVVNSNCWLHWFFVTNSPNQSAWAWYTIRAASDNFRYTIWDSNGVVWTWAQTMTATTPDNRQWVWTILSISPSVDANSAWVIGFFI